MKEFRRSIKTLLQVSLLPVVKEDERVLAPEEWTALPAIKERPAFQFGPLNNPTMDLMMLQVEQTLINMRLMTWFLGRAAALEKASPHARSH